MNAGALGFALALALLPVLACAQVVSGVSEWTVSNGSSTSDGEQRSNQSFWQRYRVGFSSVILDPRLLKYDAEVTFRTNSLAFGGSENRRRGRSNDLGYKLGASLFPARPFPFVIQASRSTIRESGDYPSSSGIRGGIFVPLSETLPDFETNSKALSLSWQLTVPSLPQVQLSYRSSSSIVAGGPFHAEQRDVDLHARVFKNTLRTRQALSFQRTDTNNVVSQAFRHQLTDLTYDFSATLSRRNRLTLRVGHRTTYSLFDIPSQIVDPGTGAYLLPSRGTVDAGFAITGITYEPHRRLSVDLTASMDQQHSNNLVTGARLLATSARYEPVRGLSFLASGTYGERDQLLGGVAVDAITRNVQAGATYRIDVRGVNANVGYSRRLGSNTTPDGGVGDIRSWTGRAGLSVSVGSVTVGGGYERAESQDEILEFGNYDSRRQFLHAQTQIGSFIIAGSWDNALLLRGRNLTLTHTRQQTFNASLSSRVGREGRLTANVGGFRGRGEYGRDQTFFWGGSYEAQVLPRLVLTMSARYDELSATGASLSQKGLGGLAKLDYRLRLFSFAVEYHYNEQRLQYAYTPDTHSFSGHQFLMKISRKFGLSL